MLTPEQIARIRSNAGAPPVEKAGARSLNERLGIAPVAEEVGEEPSGLLPKFTAGIMDRFKERGENVVEEAKNIKGEVKNIDPQSGLAKAGVGTLATLKLAGRAVGQVAGGVGDIFMEAAKAITPDELEEKISGKLQEVVSSEKVRPVVESIYNLAKKYPEAAKDAETLVNVLTLGGAGAAEKPVANAAKATAEKALSTVDDAFKALVTKSEKQIESTILKKFEKGVKPLIPGKTTPTQLAGYRDDVLSAAKTINQNKGKLSFVDDTGQAITGKNPTSLKELNEAVEQTKKVVFQEYDSLAKKAGEAGIKIKTNPIADELDVVMQNKALSITNPNAIKYAEELKDRLMRIGDLDATTAQDVIQNYNKSLEAFYRNPSYETASRASIDAMVANRMRQVLDEGISGLTGVEYQALKNQYGALKAIEKDVIKASLRDARSNTKGLIDFADIMSGGQVVGGIMSLNPAQIATGLTQKAITNYYKFLNNPNRAIEQMFKAVESLPVK